ncbi:glycine zipper 2TM domain-containing protein [Sandarakinorhabdus sp.]|uniref:glycine zipper 2TM domain-containing protein n=1 Tax=Sandarakinorhabdus sp. TaxID=1916663 RepID=UPI00286DF2A6|nr:glycine zipper 2TM domain-containing protein [Sandarakinorhabdus sp.]
MRPFFLTAALLSAALPTFAAAQPARQNCEQHRTNRIVATVAGAGIGAVLGNVIAGRGDRTLGTVIGAAGGGVLGNQIARGDGSCARALGFYDKAGVWHATNVRADQASGYYDRDSNWVEGAPRGYYDGNNRWVQTSGDNDQNGYRDRNGQWVPASANGYYDADNQYRTGVSSGYWSNGRWIAGETSGSYDRDGRWIAGASAGRRDANGIWVADAQPGYYDRDGRWHTVTTRGYYDGRGNWISEDRTARQQDEDRRNNDMGDRDRRDAMVPGHYENGRWVPGQTLGRYDDRGRWIAGDLSGRRDGNGNWVRDAEPGYFDQRGNWYAGTVRGRYDDRGGWIPDNNGNGGNNWGGQNWGADRTVQSRLNRIGERIDRGLAQGNFTRSEGRWARRELTNIRRYDRSLRTRGGRISDRNEALVFARLDRLSDRLRAMRNS